MAAVFDLSNVGEWLSLSRRSQCMEAACSWQVDTEARPSDLPNLLKGIQ